MMWIAAYLYLSGAFVTFVAISLMMEGEAKSVTLLVLGILGWPVFLPILFGHGIASELRDEYRAWRARRAGAV